MVSRQLVAGLAAFVGLSMLAGWLSAFRNRGYLGWLGFAFLSLSGWLFADEGVASARLLGAADQRMHTLSALLLTVSVLSFLIAVVSAVRETARRMREVREQYRAAEEAMLEMLNASRESEKESRSGEDRPDPSAGEDDA